MKKDLAKAMAFGLVFAMAGTATAFAEELCSLPRADADSADQVADAEVPWGILKEETPADDAAAEAPAGEEFAWKDYTTQTGKVSSVDEADENGVRVVTIDNEQGGLRFAVGVMTPVLDRESSSLIPADGLKEGMEVAVVYEANSPMGMSLPPYLGNVAAVVANADKGLYMAGHFDGNLTEAENRKDSVPLQLNISDETVILNTLGTRQMMTAEDVKGQDALVFYGITTRSIPAQTTPSLVLVLPAGQEETAPEEPEQAAGDEGPAFVPLRKTAEEMGWQVTWQGKDKPVRMEKDGLTIEIGIGKAEYVVDGDMVKQAQRKAELQDGVMFVSYEVFAE